LPSCNSADQNQSGSGPGENLPFEWGNDKNVRWSYDLAGRGWSSPVIGYDAYVFKGVNKVYCIATKPE
jgi:hypothetical protein